MESLRIYLGLGANLGDREQNIRHAVALLTALAPLRLSPLYETEPWGVLDQPRFLNAACVLEFGPGSPRPSAPEALLDLLKGIERDMGRVPTLHWGPRSMDLDILFYGDVRLNTPRLTIPHPGLLQRASVLWPLADIAPALRHPLTGLRVATHRALLGQRTDIAPYPPGLSRPTAP